MTIDEQLKQLSSEECPHKVDVVDSVMAEVEKHPYLQPDHRRRVQWRWVASAAAAVVAAIVVISVALPSKSLGFSDSQSLSYSETSTTVEAPADTVDRDEK